MRLELDLLCDNGLSISLKNYFFKDGTDLAWGAISAVEVPLPFLNPLSFTNSSTMLKNNFLFNQADLHTEKEKLHFMHGSKKESPKSQFIVINVQSGRFFFFLPWLKMYHIIFSVDKTRFFRSRFGIKNVFWTRYGKKIMYYPWT